MKQLFFTLAIMLVALTALGQSDEKIVKEILDKYQAALKSNDPGSLEPLLGESFSFVSACIRLTRAERIESIKTGLVKYDPYKEEDVKISVAATYATVIINTKVKFWAKNCNREDTASPAYLSFMKKGDQWQLSGECAGGGCVR